MRDKLLHLHALMRRHKRQFWAVLITALWLLILFITSIIFFPSHQYVDEPTFESTVEPTDFASHPEEVVTEPVPPAPEVPVVIAAAPKAAPPNTTPLEAVVQPNGSLSTIFKQLKLSQEELLQIQKLPEVKKILSRLQAGQTLRFNVLADNKIANFTLPLNSSQDLLVSKTDTGFKAQIVEHELNITTKTGSVTIETSLYQSGTKAGIPMKELVSAAQIFSGRIDFVRDIRKGDTLTVEYEEVTDPVTKKTTPGNIVAAKFTHQTTTFYAFRYRDSAGRYAYYDQNGKSLQKAFLRRPVNVGRISSPFNPKRRHPILGVLRPHLGTDFAAPYGTPIYATGDGRIAFIGTKGGYGRAIIINNGNSISTLFGHMSRFAPKEVVGTRVKMGQVIGYVGSSGLSTAPHVHYEYRIGTKHVNPMTVQLPDASSVPTSQKTAYTKYVDAQIKDLSLS
jgi:murein DD-endopeptidase MepM/ murein hydrolase activator NlpD